MFQKRLLARHRFNVQIQGYVEALNGHRENVTLPKKGRRQTVRLDEDAAAIWRRFPPNLVASAAGRLWSLNRNRWPLAASTHRPPGKWHPFFSSLSTKKQGKLSRAHARTPLQARKSGVLPPLTTALVSKTCATDATELAQRF